MCRDWSFLSHAIEGNCVCWLYFHEQAYTYIYTRIHAVEILLEIFQNVKNLNNLFNLIFSNR